MMHSWKTGLVAIFAAFILTTITSPGDTQPPDPTSEVRPNKKRRRLQRLRKRILKKKVGLSDEKVKKVTALMRVHQQNRRVLEKSSRTARKKLTTLFKADSDDQGAYAEQLRMLRDAGKGLSSLREKQMAELATVLTPKEQAKLLRAMEMVRRKLQRRRMKRRR